jgi:hypothetical protein
MPTNARTVSGRLGYGAVLFFAVPVLWPRRQRAVASVAARRHVELDTRRKPRRLVGLDVEA